MDCFRDHGGCLDPLPPPPQSIVESVGLKHCCTGRVKATLVSCTRYVFTCWSHIFTCISSTVGLSPRGGYFYIKRLGGLKLTSTLQARFGARSSQVHHKKKNLRSFVTTRHKTWEKIPILGSYLKFREQSFGYLSNIFLKAKFRAPIRILEANFGAKFWSQALFDFLTWKYPLGSEWSIRNLWRNILYTAKQKAQ